MSIPGDLPAWEEDCQGKSSLDMPIVHMSCRFFPPNYQADGKYSVTATIMAAEAVVYRASFEATTAENARAAAEHWVRGMRHHVLHALNLAHPWDPWRPIATAPKDGTLIDVVAEGQRCTDVRWGESDDPQRNAGQHGWMALDDFVGWYPLRAVTHWMPRPGKPTT